jgi:SnoaL-like domain
VVRVAGRTGDWDAFVDSFTEDVRYIEHHYGEYHGRQAVRDWIVPTMRQWPLDQMQEYPWEWYTIDAEQGWGQAANVMTDSSDGQVYKATNYTRLVYGGEGLFSEEEDMYNPADFGPMVEAWVKAWKQHHPDG